MTERARFFALADLRLQGNVDSTQRNAGAKNAFYPIRAGHGIIYITVRQDENEFIGPHVAEDFSGIKVHTQVSRGEYNDLITCAMSQRR